MSDAIPKQLDQPPPEPRGKHSADETEWQYGYGWYRFSNPAQDQGRLEFAAGTISGIYTPNRDSQSDEIDAPPTVLSPESRRVVRDALRPFLAMRKNRAWGTEESSTDEELTGPAEPVEPPGSQGPDTAANGVSQWSSAQLTSAILEGQAESDMPRLREMILIAEDTGFTVDQSGRLAPWFLSFAERRRDSSDPQDEAAVLSAIRTGASMLCPEAADRLVALLEPGHSIETCLVTVKMVGRIFEAQPPTDIDQHPALSAKVCQIAESLLNPYAIAVSQSAAMAHLAVYSLAAMAGSDTRRVVECVRELGVAWFARRMARKLRALRETWESRPVPVTNQLRELLDGALQTLERD